VGSSPKQKEKTEGMNRRSGEPFEGVDGHRVLQRRNCPGLVNSMALPTRRETVQRKTSENGAGFPWNVKRGGGGASSPKRLRKGKKTIQRGGRDHPAMISRVEKKKKTMEKRISISETDPKVKRKSNGIGYQNIEHGRKGRCWRREKKCGTDRLSTGRKNRGKTTHQRSSPILLVGLAFREGGPQAHGGDSQLCWTGNNLQKTIPKTGNNVREKTQNGQMVERKGSHKHHGEATNPVGRQKKKKTQEKREKKEKKQWMWVAALQMWRTGSAF